MRSFINVVLTREVLGKNSSLTVVFPYAPERNEPTEKSNAIGSGDNTAL